MKFHLSNALFAVLPLTVYGNSLKSIAVADKLGDQQRRTQVYFVAGIKQTTYVGMSGTHSVPLGVCEGDCNLDNVNNDCKQGLYCYMREWGEPPPPGCDGNPDDMAPTGVGINYCIPIKVAPVYDIQLLSSCTFTADGTNGIGAITCNYYTKGSADYTVSSELYAVNCSSPPPTGLQAASTGFSPALISEDNTWNLVSDRSIQAVSDYDVTITLANNAAPAGSTSIDFCQKTEVKDKDGFVYDWIGQKFKLTIGVDGTFSTDSLSTTTFDGNTAVADMGSTTFGVSIKRCDASGNENDDTDLSVGENFFLCVEGDQSAVVINNIGKLTATKGSSEKLLVAEVTGAVGLGGTRDSNTFVYGNGNNRVVIATRLPTDFFDTGGIVTFSGKANISTGGGRRLFRSMQVASTSSEAEESADFSMDVRIVGSNKDDASGASAIRATAAMFFAAVAALIV